jgi:alkyl hydroperoxide reductase subunit F
MVYDLIIVGAGPAGITAAIYAARKKMNTLVIADFIGGQAAWSGGISNYPGYQFITGPELAQKFEEHIKSFGIKVLVGTSVNSIEKKGSIFEVNANAKAFKCKTVIFATGRMPKMLGIPGEGKFLHKGVSYCATCDAPFYKDKNVAVVGGGNSALDAVLQLTKIAKKIYLIHLDKKLDADPVMVEKAKASGKVEILYSTQAKEISGKDFVQKMTVSSKGKERSLDVGGIFVEIGTEPVKIPIKSGKLQIARNERGEIMINNRCETNIPGVFAAGDVTDTPERQIIVAAGYGAVAALSAFRYFVRTIHS